MCNEEETETIEEAATVLNNIHKAKKNVIQNWVLL